MAEQPPPRARIDGISYEDGAYACVVVVPRRGIVYRTRRYRHEDAEGTVPGMRALRAAQRWRARMNMEGPDD